MMEYARENPFLAFILFIALIWAIERVIRAYIERNKPVPPCCQEDDEDDEVV